MRTKPGIYAAPASQYVRKCTNVLQKRLVIRIVFPNWYFSSSLKL